MATEDTSDVVHDVILSLLTKQQGLPNNHNELLAYATTCIRHKYLKALRHDRVRLRHAGRICDEKDMHSKDRYTGETYVHLQELNRLFGRTFSRLPNCTKKIFTMHRVQRRSYSTIAKELALAPHIVRAQMERARKALRTVVLE